MDITSSKVNGSILTAFSAFLNMESIGDESNIWVHKSHRLGSDFFNSSSWSEDQFNPSILNIKIR